jgi:hypothetical protein
MRELWGSRMSETLALEGLCWGTKAFRCVAPSIPT